jgi:hypothetical protein
MTIMVLGSIAQADPAAATRQWQRLPAEMRSDGAFQIVREWAQDDAAGAVSWLLAVPRGAERDQGLQFLAASPFVTADRRPEIIDGIDDEGRRGAAAVQAVRGALSEGDRAAAEALASRVTLPPAVYDDIRALLDGREPERRPRSTERQLRLQ